MTKQTETETNEGYTPALEDLRSAWLEHYSYPDRTFLLDAEGLCSKWGFGDGDALDDWWWDTYDDAPTIDTDDLLHALVVAYLVPAIREAGHDVELERIGTNHNPLRARTLDGQEVDHYDSQRDYFDPEILVEVSRQQIEEMVRKTVLVPKPTESPSK